MTDMGKHNHNKLIQTPYGAINPVETGSSPWYVPDSFFTFYPQ